MTTPEQIVAANKANIETVLTLANTAFASAERIAAGISAGMTVSFLAESHWPGQIELGTGVLKVGTSSVTVASAAFRDDLCIVAAEMTMVRLKGKTPHPIEDALREKLGKYRLRGF